MNTPTPDTLLLSIDDVGNMLGIRRSLVTKLLYSGQLPSITIARRRLVEREAVVAFVAARRNADSAIGFGTGDGR